ncbi:DNA alkylation repair protein [Cohnella phaseoli]|uniref:3-methyladenine DNA glycosylase AlkC n=1 Tax=Cohnella phaseoli TaxID=456490 RepID=A0A3D9KIH8_9BACL|nr:DNA alkylation repair protein [Cohnella phaseoli]RED85323.1 3-methyladenine DNA glycosylase AlkC [Cohnella phaseoli]
MAEPLKAIYNAAFLKAFGDKVKQAYEKFDVEGFLALVLGEGWEGLELKQRMRRITESLRRTLPEDYGKALDVLDAIADKCRGFPYLFFPDFVEKYGLNDWERSMRALERYTSGSSAEFAVRPFIKLDQERMMAQMLEWSAHPDEHVRRLASEGCRPRLPWGEALGALKRDPAPIWPILERLKADPSEYVRRSVANNLNDISKDHPQLVLDLAKAWQGVDQGTDWIIRHACRGLLKAANPEAMALFGLAPLGDIEVLEWEIHPARLSIGEAVEFRYGLRAPTGDEVKLRLELAVFFPRSNGKLYRKLFKLSEKSIPGGAYVQGGRGFSFADLSTRRHYPGVHRMALVANGREVAHAEVELTADTEQGGAQA